MSEASISGYDIVYAEVGRYKDLHCKVCSKRMNVKRGVYGVTSFAAAMGQVETKHDRFTCRYSKTAWHYKAYKLLREIEATSSDSLQAILQEDLYKILNENT